MWRKDMFEDFYKEIGESCKTKWKFMSKQKMQNNQSNMDVELDFNIKPV